MGRRETAGKTASQTPSSLLRTVLFLLFLSFDLMILRIVVLLAKVSRMLRPLFPVSKHVYSLSDDQSPGTATRAQGQPLEPRDGNSDGHHPEDATVTDITPRTAVEPHPEDGRRATPRGRQKVHPEDGRRFTRGRQEGPVTGRRDQ